MLITVTHCSLQQRVKRVGVDMHRDAGGWRHCPSALSKWSNVGGGVFS